MITYGCDYKASNLMVSIYLHCCFHWFEQPPKHCPYNRSDKKFSSYNSKYNFTPFFKTSHLLPDKKWNFCASVNRYKPENKPRISDNLIARKQPTACRSIPFLSSLFLFLIDGSMSFHSCLCLTFDKVNWRFHQIFLFLMYNFAISKHLWSTSLP